jgi:hypothetical protein
MRSMSFTVNSVRLRRGFVTLVDSAVEASQTSLLATKAVEAFLDLRRGMT